MKSIKLIYFIIVLFILGTITINASERTLLHSKNIDNIVNSAIKNYAFPGAVIAVGSYNRNYMIRAYGYNTYAKKEKNRSNSIFDLASMTKVCATTPAIMKLYDQGKIKLSDNVVKYLPAFTSSNKLQKKLKAEVTIENLLTHTSGLPPDNDIYKMRNATLKEKWNSIYKTPLVYYTGVKEKYSDVNMLLLEKIIEKVSGMPLNVYVTKEIYKPLGMNHTFFNPPKKYINAIIPTEYSISTNRTYKGVVDDENARSLGGIAGHAGLFSTAKDLSVYAKMLLNNGKYRSVQIFKPSTIKLFATRANIIKGSSRALGFDTVYNPKYIIPKKDRRKKDFILNKSGLYRDPHQASAGLYIDPNAFGHTGYTGTSIWISPKNNMYVILLTNRVFPFRNYTPYRVFAFYRQKINSAIWKNLGFKKKNQLYQQQNPHYYHKAN